MLHFSPLPFLLEGYIVEREMISKLSDYRQLNLKWNIESMLYINKAGFLIEDLLDEKIGTEALIRIMIAGTKNKDASTIMQFINKYFRKYKELDTLIKFIILDLKYKHKFLSDTEEDEEPINELLAGKEDDEIKESRETKLSKNKANYEYVILTFMKAGYTVEQALNRDMNNFDLINNYVISEHEEKLNDLMILAHRAGLLTGIAFANMKKYPDKPEKIRLKPLSKEERKQQLIAEAEKFRREAIADLKEQ